jgi:hypothetical protein
MDKDDLYSRAVLVHTEKVLAMFVGERLINKIFARVFQSHAMGRLVIAHFEWEARAAAPPTLARLQADIGDSRTLAAFIGIARAARLLSFTPHPTDRRQKILVPSARIVDGLREWLHHHLHLTEILGMVPVGTARRLLDDAPYFGRFVRASKLVIDGLADARTRYPLWDMFESRECGLRIAYALIAAHYRACAASIPSVAACVDLDLTGGALARMLGLSKSHVRNVLNDAERLGALSHDPARRRMRLSPAFLAEARACFLDMMALFARAHVRSDALVVAAPA